jgi:hypothetical protein
MSDRRVGERRRQRRRVTREQRTGFDRRVGDRHGVARVVGSTLRTLRDRPLVLGILLVEANLLNLCDYLLTRFGLSVGAIQEANPVMRGLFSTDARLAGIVKVLIVLGASLTVWKFRRFRPVLATGLIVVGMLLLVVVYQEWGWAVLVA